LEKKYYLPAKIWRSYEKNIIWDYVGHAGARAKKYCLFCLLKGQIIIKIKKLKLLKGLV
jgi:hypothetical protein